MFSHLFGAYNRDLRPEFYPGRLCYLSVRAYATIKRPVAGSPLWFTATNPGFPLGGLYPTSKWDVLKQLPSEYVPESILIEADEFDIETIQKNIARSAINFPMIIKPDNGLRGLGIQIFHNQSELDDGLAAYVDENKRRGAWLVQEFIEYPLELGVFYIRKASEESGTVTGIVEKEFLELIGDGENSFEVLVNNHPRAKYHREFLKEQFSSRRDEIILEGESIDIVEIGTHSRGSTFLDASDAVTPELTELFDTLSKSIDGFYYGRYDVRAESIEGLIAGKFKIMEVNPTYGEPTWMYDPSYSFLKQQKILLSHWSMMFDVAQENHKAGVPYATIQQWRKAKKEFMEIV